MMIDAAKVRRCASSASVRDISSSFFGDAGGDWAGCDGVVGCADAVPNKDSAHNQKSKTKTLIERIAPSLA